MYNEMVILKLVQSMSKMISNPSEVFREQIERHFCECGESMYRRIKSWMDASNEFNERNKNNALTSGSTANGDSNTKCDEEEKKRPLPEFSLVPASRGFCLTLVGLLENFCNKLDTLRRMTGVNNGVTSSEQLL